MALNLVLNGFVYADGSGTVTFTGHSDIFGPVNLTINALQNVLTNASEITGTVTDGPGAGPSPIPTTIMGVAPGFPFDDGSGDEGMPGMPGQPGGVGATGLQGIPGIFGLDGNTGDEGMPGIPGQIGATGATGATGASGFGVPGISGDDGEEGIPTSISLDIKHILGLPTGTGFWNSVSGVLDAVAMAYAIAAVKVSSFNLTGLTIPLASSFTNANGGTATFATADKSNRFQVSMTGSSNGGTTIAVATQNAALIATPYTIDIGLMTTFPPGSTGALTGIFLSDGTKYLAFYAGVSSGAGKIFIDSYTVRTSGTVVNKLNINTATISQPIWLRITDSGTTRNYLISPNGQDYTVAFSEPTNTFLTPTATGICQFYTGGQSVKAAVQHYLVSSGVLGDGA